MTTKRPRPLYVLDTHTLFWLWTKPSELSPAAIAVLEELRSGQAFGLVPTVVVGELFYLSIKLGKPQTVKNILLALDSAPSLRLESITREHLIAFDELEGVRDMHDRLIGATALLNNAPLISRDSVLRKQPHIQVIW